MLVTELIYCAEIPSADVQMGFTPQCESLKLWFALRSSGIEWPRCWTVKGCRQSPEVEDTRTC
jgi:hypothetical protein